MTNITLAIDDDVLAKGRECARLHNMSFNSFVRKLVEDAAYPVANGAWADEVIALGKKLGGNSHGKKWSRDELHER